MFTADYADLVKLETNTSLHSEDVPDPSIQPNSNQEIEQLVEDEDDPIVHRIPVYLSQELANNLYLVQYPLRPVDRPYTDVGPLVQAQIKPKQRRLEMSYTMDQRGPHYDPSADFDMPQLKLTSKPIPPKTNLAIGVYTDEKVVLTPLHATVRMVPSFQFIDEALDDDRLEAERRKNGGVLPKELEEDDLIPIMLRFKKHGNVDSTASRRINYTYLTALKNSESWVPLALENEMEKDRITDILKSSPEAPTTFELSGTSYLHYINNLEEVFGDSDVPIEVNSSHLTFEERLVYLLSCARTISFSQICIKMHIQTTEEIVEALRILSKKSFLVQGNFVYKSENIYNLQTFRGHYKTVLTRNLVMSYFAKSITLNREEVAKIVSVDHTVLTEILEELGERVGDSQYWRFKLPRDETFISHFHSHVQLEGEK